MSDAAGREGAAARSRAMNPCKTGRARRADVRGSDGAAGRTWGGGRSDVRSHRAGRRTRRNGRGDMWGRHSAPRRRRGDGRADTCSSGPITLMHASKAVRDRSRAGRGADAADTVAIGAVRAVLLPAFASLRRLQLR
jgi:hypothetical protein